GLGECLASSRTALGARWLDVYLTSPAWRCVCAAGACGPVPVIGVAAPSVDQVGRYFPLTLVAELPPDVSLLAAASCGRFFEAAEQLVIETLATERVDFERFDQGTLALERALTPIALPPDLVLDPSAAAIVTDTPQAWQIPLAAASDVTAALEQMLSLHLAAQHPPVGFV